MMFRPRALAAALSKVNTGGIQSVMLFNLEGVLMAFTSVSGEGERSKAAIAASIWNIYQRHLQSTESDTVQEILMDFSQGRLIITRIASVLLCIHASKDVGLGMLRAKANALVQSLQEPLSILAAS
ncbi:unnamed protein product [Calicophoron daubneyi]|uniref:Roadblock/LAMTOR2 domain-containing protein n=1 Tax=Calicophoron daubneyi TaxID=300641 RepID=A0AAV2SZG0_CALDB